MHDRAGRQHWFRDDAVLVDQGGGTLLKTSIFQPFRKGEAGTPGSGIGLSLVARFAEFHGGRAWVQDRPGGGAAFRVFFPNRDHGEGLTGPPESPSQSGSGDGP
jgi:K+-sensing histidine kinase KdpD